MKTRTFIGLAASVFLMGCLAACGGRVEGVGSGVDATSPQSFRIGGNVSGLADGAKIELTISNGSGGSESESGTLTITDNAGYSFDSAVPANGTYVVAVTGQPIGQTCSVNHYTGSGLTADVLNVDITCSTLSYTVTANVKGLAPGAQLTLTNNGADPLVANADGSFTFATGVPYNGNYTVTAAAQPGGQTCTVSNQSGSGMTTNVNNVSVTCSTNSFTISGKLTGLALGAQLTLNNNAADPLTLSANGSFTFATPVAYHASYSATVATQPLGQTCSVSNFHGSGITADVEDMSVTCSESNYVIGGTVSGLTSGTQVTLNNNASDPLSVSSNGNFQFSAPVPYNGSFAITVGTQPSGLLCKVLNDSSSGVSANVSNVIVNCAVPPVFVYATNYSDNSVSQYRVGAGGILTALPISSVATANSPDAIAIDGTGHYAYVANRDSNSISQYSIGSDGTLVPSTPATVSTGSRPYWIVIDPSNRHLYVLNVGDRTISQFAIEAGGSLTAMTPPRITTGFASSMMIDPMGRYLYLAGASSVSQYSIDASGALSPTSWAGVTAGSLPVSFAFDPIFSYVYVPSQYDSRVNQYTVGAAGELIPMNPSFVVAGTDPSVFALDGTSRYGYCINYSDNTVSQYFSGAGGMLQTMSVQTVATGSGPIAISIDPNNQYAYVVNSDDDTISQFSIGADGGLIPIGVIATGRYGTAIASTKGH